MPACHIEMVAHRHIPASEKNSVIPFVGVADSFSLWWSARRRCIARWSAAVFAVAFPLGIAVAPIHSLAEHVVHHLFLEVVDAQNLILGEKFAVFGIVFLLDVVDFLPVGKAVLNNLSGLVVGQ